MRLFPYRVCYCSVRRRMAHLLTISSYTDWGTAVETSPLNGRTILLVEDEALVMLDLSETVRHAGARVVPVSSVTAGINAIGRESIQGAIVDIGLHGEDCGPLCRQLTASGIKFLFY